MAKITKVSLTLLIFASTSLIIYLLNDQMASSANINSGMPSLAQNLQNQNPEQEYIPVQNQIPNEETNTLDPAANEEIPTGDFEQYKARVSFDSIRVHNDHEGFGSGDGEYDLSAYVHGQKVDLTALSTWKDSGLRDVSSGENVQFRTGNFIVVDLDSFTPLTILTLGWEDDGCKSGGGLLPKSIKNVITKVVSNQTKENASKAVGGGVGAYYGGEQGAQAGQTAAPAILDAAESALSGIENGLRCLVNDDDSLGKITEAYEPPRFGVGTHTVQSDTKDYTLTYNIKAIKLKQPQAATAEPDK
jgi:hypothetical protein